MKKEKMQLTLIPSPEMDRLAQRVALEHEKIRMSKRARIFYGPSNWQKIYLKIHGAYNEKNLRIGQAIQKDIKEYGPQTARQIGFVTTKTYEYLMGKKALAVNNSIWISEPTEKITVGCDPEFALVGEDGIAIYADSAFSYDTKFGKLGSDGPCAELRPDAATSTEELIKNIEELFKNQSGAIEQYKWLGGATYSHPGMQRKYSIGGHLHFGLPNLPEVLSNKNFILQRRVGRVLDELVALPLVRIDTPNPDARRGLLNYGKFEDMKTYEYKFEWRVPSGLWLVHKDIALAVINTAKAVVEESWKRFSDRDCDKDFMLNTTEGDNLISSFDCIDTETVRSLINSAKPASVDTNLIHTIHGKLKNMSTYCIYKNDIDNFIKLCCSTSMPLKTNQLELRESWIHNKSL